VPGQFDNWMTIVMSATATRMNASVAFDTAKIRGRRGVLRGERSSRPMRWGWSVFDHPSGWEGSGDLV
jgi:hypothetical protein